MFRRAMRHRAGEGGKREQNMTKPFTAIWTGAVQLVTLNGQGLSARVQTDGKGLAPA